MTEQPPELSEAAKAEIADAVRIVASDRGYSMMRKVHDHLIPPTPETTPPKEGEPTAPPKGDDKQPPETPKKAGLWWPAHQVGDGQE